MFGHASQQVEIRAAAALATTAYAYADGPTGSTGRVSQMATTQIGFTVVMAGRTAGSVTASLQGKLTASGSWFDLSTQNQATASANGQASIAPTQGGPLPPYLRVKLAPAGGFDGTIQVLESWSPPSAPIL